MCVYLYNIIIHQSHSHCAVSFMWGLLRLALASFPGLLRWGRPNSYHVLTSATVHMSKSVWDDLPTFVLAIVLNMYPRCSEAFVD